MKKPKKIWMSVCVITLALIGFFLLKPALNHESAVTSSTNDEVVGVESVVRGEASSECDGCGHCGLVHSRFSALQTGQSTKNVEVTQ